MIGQQRIAYGHTVAVGPPKTQASRRTIALDRHTVRLLRAPLPTAGRTQHRVYWHNHDSLDALFD